jgi:hypothetical protein
VGPPRPPTTAYDEAEDVKYYRRVNVIQRQRRLVWASEAESDTPVGDRTQQTQEHVDLEESNNLGNSENIELLGDAVDAWAFEQILEMDDEDDEIEREFSRSLILGTLEAVERGIRKMQDEL